MIKEMTTEKYTLPVYWASALVNGDTSGMSDADEKEMNDWLSEVKPGNCVGVSEDSWFAHNNDATRLGGDVAEFTFIQHQQ
jgi:hypothetical protein